MSKMSKSTNRKVYRAARVLMIAAMTLALSPGAPVAQTAQAQEAYRLMHQELTSTYVTPQAVWSAGAESPRKHLYQHACQVTHDTISYCFIIFLGVY